MHSRWFNLAVALLWVSTMSWLVVSKVLPATLVGEPPSYRTIVEAQRAQRLVGWIMSWEGQRLGWAVSTTRPLEQGLTEVRSRVHFEALPLGPKTPEWLRSVLGPLETSPGQFRMEADNTLVFDPLHRLSRFESAVRFPPMEPMLKVYGSIDGPKMNVSMRCGDFTQDFELPAPHSAMLSDSTSPQAVLPGLRAGQKWTVEVYSPLAPPSPSSLIEVLEATVEGEDWVVWDGRPVSTWLVVYRSDPGSRLGPQDGPRARLWVHPDGTVLRQEVNFFGSVLAFTRLGPEEAAALAGRSPVSRRLRKDQAHDPIP